MNPVLLIVAAAVGPYFVFSGLFYTWHRRRWAPIIRGYKYPPMEVPGWWLGYWRWVTFRYWVNGARHV